MNKEDVLKQEVNEEELENVSGGSAAGPGGCDKEYYSKKCVATVETGSWCGSNDFCTLLECRYTIYDPS